MAAAGGDEIYFLTSASQSTNVDVAFEEIARRALAQEASIAEESQSFYPDPTIRIQDGPSPLYERPGAGQDCAC